MVSPDILGLALNTDHLSQPGHLPLLTCSVFYKQMYGNLKTVTLPGHYLQDLKLDDLHCGTTYQVYSRCSNQLGQGSISTQLSQRTNGTKPSVPDTSLFLHPSNDSVRLDLFAWSNEACPVSYFVVEYKSRMVHIVLVHSHQRVAQSCACSFRTISGLWFLTTYS